jgi:(1->4)-alpha-D-glucan 1-alpha-D-glucosylmutase
MPSASSSTEPVSGQTVEPDPAARSVVPGATYRVQLHAGFTFRQAEAIVGYLHRLGVTHLYCSSFLQAVPGSPHGYDVADPTSLNVEIGTEEDYRALVAVLRAHGMALVLDVVPNHMGIAKSRNRFWQDVLENGPSSRYAKVFDIDWRPVKPELADKVLLPILGDQYGKVLERQEIRLEYGDGSFRVRHFETVLPVAPRSYPRVLRHGVDALAARLGDEHPDLLELLSIVTSLDHLPRRTDLDPERLAERQREKEIAKRRLGALTASSAGIRAFIEANVALFNGRPGDPRSFDLLDGLLGEQAYRLSHWRVASEEINYRRFFDINELAAVRMEDEKVFDEAHSLVFALVADGSLSGLRIDHVDGLYDPGDYLRRLQARARELRPGRDPAVYLVVEKILARDELLPPDWPVDGTTGYEFANLVNGLFVDGRAARAFDDIYVRFTGDRQSFDDLAYRAKKLIMQVGMASEINALAHQLNTFSERNRHYRDFTLNSIVHAIREIIAAFPVYRTYVPSGTAPASDRDRHYIELAVTMAKRRNPAATWLVFDFIRDLLLKRADYIPEAERDDYARFVAKFQQTTSPVTAKGVEDTALYVYTRLVSLNEVGGDPTRFGTPPAELHAWLADRAHRWPAALSTTSTHDTKRSEDVRARIDVLSEIPGAWKSALARASRAGRRHQQTVAGLDAPDRSEEWLLHQTLLGAWPFEALDGAPPGPEFTERICAYMVKAMREAKRHTSWLNPWPEWEDAVTSFVRANLDPRTGAGFLDALRPLAVRVAHAGIWNSLAQVLVKATAPGVPDFYQGTESWDLSLVDPDNRRPVDYARRRAMLGEVEGPLTPRALAEIVRHRTDGRLKVLVIARALAARHARLRLFARGGYLPLDVRGSRAAHVFAFARTEGHDTAVTIVPRLTTGLVSMPADVPAGDGAWGNTEVVLPTEVRETAWTEVITGRTVLATPGAPVRLSDACAVLPVALLTRA